MPPTTSRNSTTEPVTTAHTSMRMPMSHWTAKVPGATRVANASAANRPLLKESSTLAVGSDRVCMDGCNAAAPHTR